MDSESRLKLRFRIVECSSEDSQHPASELLAASSQSNGWCSQRFCSFPQHITFQFLSPVQLKQLQFLSHESRIPSKIEIHVAMPEAGLNSPLSTVKFKKLGHLTLDPNERSGFKLRELKTVYVEVHCLYIRLVFHKCHLNKHNFFNQAGLVAMIPFGSTMTSASAKTLKKANPLLQPLPTLSHRKEPTEQESMPIDQAAAKKLKQLEEAKSDAVKHEDYEKADRLKQEIYRIQHFGSQLRRLEDKKAVAVQNEDYETATMVKHEISRIREMIYKPLNPLGSSSPHKQIPTGGSRNELNEPRAGNIQTMKRNQTHGQLPSRQNTHHFNTRENEQEDEEEDERQEEEYYENPRGHRSPGGHNGYPQNQNGYNHRQGYEDEEYDEYEGEQEEEYNNRYHQPRQTIIPHDEVVIPALTKKEQNPEEEQMQTQKAVQEAEELLPANQKLAEPLLPVLGMELCKKIFSKHWNMREDALKILTAEVQRDTQSTVLNNQDPWNTFVAVLGAISRTITDKVSQVSAMSQTVLRTLLNKRPPNIGSKNEMVMYMDTTLKTLLEKIGDINTRVRELAEESLMSMIRSPVITCNYCLSVILRDMAPTTGKGNLLAKYTLARIRVLQKVVKEFKIDTHDVPYLPVVDFAVEKLENPNADVRSGAINLLADIYRIVGERLKKDLDGVRPAHLELLDKEFMATGGDGRPQNQTLVKSQSKELLRPSKKSLR